MIKLSDYVICFLEAHHVGSVFGYQGSSIAHTVDSISRSNIRFVEMRHEQAAAFAACGYAIQKGVPGIALACSGPGALNLISGIANAWYDSIPCLFITGQVSRSGIHQGSAIRQLGFQETDITSIVAPISKYAVTVTDPQMIRYQLEKAWSIMCNGRKGPVLIDIPHDVQAAMVDEQSLPFFTESKEAFSGNDSVAKLWCEKLSNAERPLLLLGGGAAKLRGTGLLEAFCERTNIPVVSSYLGKDILNNEDVHYVGTIGAYGNRLANLAIHYSDLVLTLGSRLDGRQTGDNIEAFAANAEVFCVDVDRGELAKLPHRTNVCCMEAEEFLRHVMLHIGNAKSIWLSQLNFWRNELAQDKEYPALADGVNPNRFFRMLSKQMSGCSITTDVGQNQIWTNTSTVLSKGGRLIQSGGLGSMGFSLPASIGVAEAEPQKVVLSISGDGGFQMNMQELQTVATNCYAVHSYIMNNHSLGLIRVYQEKALKNNYIGSVDGFGNPNYETIAKAYGIPYYHLYTDEDCDMLMPEICSIHGACLVEVEISRESVTFPEPAYKMPVYCQHPEIPDSVIRKFEESIGYERED